MSRRKDAPLGVVLAALLATGAAAQTMDHPCDSRAIWPPEGSHDKLPITDDDGLFFTTAFDFLTLSSNKVKSIPAVARFFNKRSVNPDAARKRDPVDEANKDCIATTDSDFFVQCDAVLNRAYLGVGKIYLAEGHWLAVPEKPEEAPTDATIKQAREALTFVCDQYDSRRQAYAAKLRNASDMAAAHRAALIPGYHVTQANAEKVAQAEDASEVKAAEISPDVNPYDARLQSNVCRHMCEAYLAFGADGCFPGMDADELKWCAKKEREVKVNRCICR